MRFVAPGKRSGRTRIPDDSVLLRGAAQTPQIGARYLDAGAELLIYFLVVFTPWAFGTTESWSMRLANGAGYTLGILQLARRCIIQRDGVERGRPPTDDDANRSKPRASLDRTEAALAALTIAILGYVLVSLLNARASFVETRQALDYSSSISWLPHTYDESSTWPAFWNYVAWACVFWSVRDWVRGDKPPRPRGHGTRATGGLRLRRLLWVIAVNGALLAFVGLIQQTTGTNKLLAFKSTYYNRQAQSQFGPFAYRANGAQYLNLVWPVALGLWWSTQRRLRPLTPKPPLHHLLLGGIVLMIVGPMMSLSRGGAFVSAGLVLACATLVVLGGKGMVPTQRLGIACLLTSGLVGGAMISWRELAPRLAELKQGFEIRDELAQVGRRMAAENPIFGTGAETLQNLYQFYRASPDESWPGQLHNDWLETRVTFGWVGFSLMLAALMIVIARRFRSGAAGQMSWRMISFFWIAMGGCLLHARWDLPFQVYSIVLLFLIYCAVL